MLIRIKSFCFNNEKGVFHFAFGSKTNTLTLVKSCKILMSFWTKVANDGQK
jgi:hypothetical protein